MNKIINYFFEEDEMKPIVGILMFAIFDVFIALWALATL